MARGSSINLELPAGALGDRAQEALFNERFRRIASLIDSPTAASGNNLILSVPGTLAIQANAAPLVSLPASRTLSGLLALLKRPPLGGDVVVRFLAAGVEIARVTIPAGLVRAESAAGNPTIAAAALITVDITAVGWADPGADLTLIAQLA